MTAQDLKAFLDTWELSDSEGAKVLRIQKSKMSEYLSGSRTLPPYVAAHVETFNELAKTKGQKLIKKRLM
ncbi:hypothetical protein ACP3V5_17770 [Vibrio maritimus]